MTENTPAGGAVAWRHVYFRDGKRIGTGPWRDIGERINEQQGDDIEYAYTTPPATVSADAVLALVGKWRSEASKHDEDAQAARYYRQFKRARQIESIAFYKRRDADELEALTRGERNG